LRNHTRYQPTPPSRCRSHVGRFVVMVPRRRMAVVDCVRVTAHVTPVIVTVKCGITIAGRQQVAWAVAAPPRQCRTSRFTQQLSPQSPALSRHTLSNTRQDDAAISHVQYVTHRRLHATALVLPARKKGAEKAGAVVTHCVSRLARRLPAVIRHSREPRAAYALQRTRARRVSMCRNVLAALASHQVAYRHVAYHYRQGHAVTYGYDVQPRHYEWAACNCCTRHVVARVIPPRRRHARRQSQPSSLRV